MYNWKSTCNIDYVHMLFCELANILVSSCRGVYTPRRTSHPLPYDMRLKCSQKCTCIQKKEKIFEPPLALYYLEPDRPNADRENWKTRAMYGTSRMQDGRA